MFFWFLFFVFLETHLIFYISCLRTLDVDNRKGQLQIGSTQDDPIASFAQVGEDFLGYKVHATYVVI